MVSSELFDLGDAITLVHHLDHVGEASSPADLTEASSSSLVLLSLSSSTTVSSQVKHVHTERKEVSMARLMSIAAAVALMLSAAFAAGLTCGG
jgi:hypothetical protein